MHTLKRIIKLPITLDEAWDFFSDPRNLKIITPDYMNFSITSEFHQEKMYAGQIITYTVTPLLNLPLRWMTEITQVKDKQFFIDDQRVGPYKVWHHQHHFKRIEGGVEMTDLIDYVIPLGFLGRLIEPILVSKKLEEIFNYREKKMKELFGVLN